MQDQDHNESQSVDTIERGSNVCVDDSFYQDKVQNKFRKLLLDFKLEVLGLEMAEEGLL